MLSASWRTRGDVQPSCTQKQLFSANTLCSHKNQASVPFSNDTIVPWLRFPLIFSFCCCLYLELCWLPLQSFLLSFLTVRQKIECISWNFPRSDSIWAPISISFLTVGHLRSLHSLLIMTCSVVFFPICVARLSIANDTLHDNLGWRQELLIVSQHEKTRQDLFWILGPRLRFSCGSCKQRY